MNIVYSETVHGIGDQPLRVLIADADDCRIYSTSFGEEPWDIERIERRAAMNGHPAGRARSE